MQIPDWYAVIKMSQGLCIANFNSEFWTMLFALCDSWGQVPNIRAKLKLSSGELLKVPALFHACCGEIQVKIVQKIDINQNILSWWIWKYCIFILTFPKL